jgi:hypothetical protein
MKYQVYVGNIGMVYDGESHDEANQIFDEYVNQSKNDYGRASGEDVSMFEEHEFIRDYLGKIK